MCCCLLLLCWCFVLWAFNVQSKHNTVRFSFQIPWFLAYGRHLHYDQHPCCFFATQIKYFMCEYLLFLLFFLGHNCKHIIQKERTMKIWYTISQHIMVKSIQSPSTIWKVNWNIYSLNIQDKICDKHVWINIETLYFCHNGWVHILHIVLMPFGE